MGRLVSHSLKYGDSRIQLRYPHELSVVLKPGARSTNPSGTPCSEREVLERALAAPLGTDLLSSLAARRPSRPVIVINDITRPTPTHRILPLLVEQLRPLRPTVLVALGNHRRQRPEELRLLLGDLELPVVEHESGGADLVSLGTTIRGTRATVNRHYADSDLRVVVGQVAFHPFAGYSGGAKMVIPGLAGDQTIEDNHSHWPHPRATIGAIAGNPIREDLEEAARLCPPDFAINVVLNTQNSIVEASCGDVTASHREAVALHDQYYRSETRRLGDAVVVSAGGFPKDIDFRQASKALVFAARTVEPTAPILLLAECREGIGSAAMEQLWFSATTAQRLATHLESTRQPGAQRVHPTAKICAEHAVTLVSSLDDRLARRLFVTPAQSAQAWLDLRAADGGRVVFLPEPTILNAATQ